MVDPELYSVVSQAIRSFDIWHYHCKECAENIDEDREIIKLFHSEDQHQRDNKHRRIAKVKRPGGKICENGEIVTVTEGYHRSHADIDQGVASLFVITSVEEEMNRKTEKGKSVEDKPVMHRKIFYFDRFATKTEYSLRSPAGN